MAAVLRTGVAEHNHRVVVERPDGSRVTALVNIDPLFDENGVHVGAVNCFQDISELARAYEDLQRSKDDLEDFFENSAVALHVVGTDGTILRANKAELTLLNYEAEDYVGRRIAEFHADASTVEDILLRLRRGESICNYPARLRAKDGSIKHVLITSNAQIKNGELVQTRCFTIDVTATKRAEQRADEGQKLFYRVLDSLPAAVYTTDPEGKVTFYNLAAVELAGREPQLGTDEWCVTWRLYRPDGTALPHDECPMAVALRQQRAMIGPEAIAERPDGTRVRFLPHPTPLFGQDGRLVGMINMLVDITARHEAEFQSAQLAAIVESSNDAIISKSLTGEVYSWNAGAARLLGYQPEEMVGQPITRIIPEELHREEQHILARLQGGECIDSFETIRVAKNGRRVDVSATISPVRDKDGTIIGASTVARDITERKRAEELQRLLISELNHRVKNTLATVQSIANQTARLAHSPADFADSFSGRIRALAYTHDLLTRNSWQGADMLALVQDQLLLGGTADSRISLSGPSVTLNTQSTLHLAMVLHELGTNARKYGSLSVPHGRLSVRWSVEPGATPTLKLTWEESGGPAVSLPGRTGFGATLIERSLSAHGGEARLRYRPSGVVCEITMLLLEQADWHRTLFAASWPSATLEPIPEAPPALAAVQGQRVLVIEDEPLIALDLTHILSDAGAIPVGPATTVEDALELMAATDFDAALLDANLGGKPVDALAAELTRLGTPFAFVTGYGRDWLPTAFQGVPVVTKPLTGEIVVQTIARLLKAQAELQRSMA